MKNLNPLSVTLPPVHSALTGSPLLSGEVFFMEEIWKPIKNYEGLYEISNMGRVRNTGLTYRGIIILSQTTSNTGYKRVYLTKNKFGKTELVHRLVLSSFIENKYNKETVNHKNGDKGDNRLSNLEWNTWSENAIHSHRVLGKKSYMCGRYGKLNKNSKIVYQYTLDKKLVKVWESIGCIERELGFAGSNISNCCNNKNKFSHKFMWSFIEIV